MLIDCTNAVFYTAMLRLYSILFAPGGRRRGSTRQCSSTFCRKHRVLQLNFRKFPYRIQISVFGALSRQRFHSRNQGWKIQYRQDAGIALTSLQRKHRSYTDLARCIPDSCSSLVPLNDCYFSLSLNTTDPCESRDLWVAEKFHPG